MNASTEIFDAPAAANADTDIVLNLLEFLIALVMAWDRTSSNRKNNVPNKLVTTDRAPFFFEFIGALGELAFNKYVKKYPEDSFNSGSRGADSVVCNITVDVKTTPRDGPLVVTDYKEGHGIERYALVHIVDDSLRRFRIIGWATHGEVFAEENKRADFAGKGPCYVVDRAKLHPMRPWQP